MQYSTQARGRSQAVRDDNILSIVTEHILHELAEVLTGGLLLLEVLLLVHSLLEIEVLLSDGLEPLAVVLLELLDSILVDGVGHEE